MSGYKKQIPAELLKAAGKIKIRECEEAEPGRFVAFAEDGKQDFDVSISVSANGEVTGHSCDCESKAPICAHKAAMLLFMAEGMKKKTDKAKKATKRSETEILLEQVPEEELRNWLREIFLSEKNLALLFKAKFSASAAALSRDEIFKLTKDAVKSVLESRRTADKSDVKKIGSVFQQVHRPVMLAYTKNPANPESFDGLSALLASVFDMQDQIGKGRSIFSNYIISIMKEAAAALFSIEPEDEWTEATDHFLNQIFLNSDFRMAYFYLNQSLQIYSLCREEFRENHIMRLMLAYERCPINRSGFKKEMQKEILPYLSVEDGSFKKYFRYFEPLTYEPIHNELLVENLIAIGEGKLAEKFCLSIIKGNSQEHYSFPFYHYLKSIYEAEGNHGKVVEMKALLLPATYSLADYKQVIASLKSVDEVKEFRRKILHRARYSDSPEGQNFPFLLSIYERDYKKAASQIKGSTTFDMILENWENLQKADFRELLKGLMTEANSLTYKKDAASYLEQCKNVMAKMLETFEFPVIQWAIKQYSSTWHRYPLIEYLKENLPQQGRTQY